MKQLLVLVIALFAVAPLSPAADVPWDASRYMRVAEVKPGMVGYGLTVFSGAKIDRFDVQVVDVVNNLINPKCAVILITCKNDYLIHLGPVEGMSGSPIFLYDLSDTAHLHPRMVGAFAYGWEWSKDPLAGVQPIEYMLKIAGPAPESDASGNSAPTTPQAQIARPLWSLADVPALPGFTHNGAGYLVHSQAAGRAPDIAGLHPLATPLMASGLSPSLTRQFAPMFSAAGMNLLAGAAAGQSADTRPDIRMEPGAVLVCPLLIGDVELNAAGTTTEVRGDRLYAFGHDFNNEGPIRLPMGTGTVATIVADLHSSFKIASLAKLCGTLTNDQSVGVAGTLGQDPPMAPIQFHVHYADGSLDQTYNFKAALHPKFTPMVVASAIGAAVSGIKDLPEFHTLTYNLTVDFADGRAVHIVNRDANDQAAELAQALTLPILAGTENPFKKIPIAKITGNIEVSSEVRLADINSITLPKLKYEPGVRVKAFVAFRPWRTAEQTMPINFDLPKDLPDGQYQLVVSDWDRFFADQRQAEPFRFTAETIDELFGVVNDFEALRHDALYVRLIRQADGVAVGRQAMPRLPASMRQQALLGAGRSDLTAFVTSSVQTIPTDWVMSGAAEFTVTIDREPHSRSTTQP